MKNIKTYEDFVNEEINWRKAATGVALGASLLGGMASCKKSDMKPDEIHHVKPQTKETGDIKLVFDKVSSRNSSDSVDIKVERIEDPSHIYIPRFQKVALDTNSSITLPLEDLLNIQVKGKRPEIFINGVKYDSLSIDYDNKSDIYTYTHKSK